MSTSRGLSEPRTRFAIKACPKRELAPALLTLDIDHTVKSQIWGCSPALGVSRLARGIVLRCYRVRDGTRLFLPEWEAEGKGGLAKRQRAGWEQLLQTAGAIGVALIERGSGEPTPESCEEARQHAVMLTYREYACRSREYLSRHFGSRKDLVARVGRSGRDTRGLFPEGLGNSSGAGKGWPVDRVIDAGREAMSAKSSVQATFGQWITAGVYAAVSAAPWPAPSTPEERQRKLRAALFRGIAPTDAHTRNATQEAFSQAERLHREYLTGSKESLNQYRQWHRGKSTNVPRSMRKALINSGCDDDTARRAVAELCWWSVWYSASAVSFAMKYWLATARVAAGEIEQPLTDREVKLFEVMYVGVRETCGVPLAALYERFDVLEPWLAALGNAPGAVIPDWETFYSVLSVYAAIAIARRQADDDKKDSKRARKKQTKASERSSGKYDEKKHAKKETVGPTAPKLEPQRTGKSSSHTSRRESVASERQESADTVVSDVVDQLCASLRCSCGESDWKPEKWFQTDQEVDFPYTCHKCANVEHVTRTIEQFAELCDRARVSSSAPS